MSEEYRQALQDGAERGRMLLRCRSYAAHAQFARATPGNDANRFCSAVRTDGWAAHLLATQLRPKAAYVRT